jgi:hypothetical protein
MGREIRMVKKGWEHPKDDQGNYQPMYDEYYLDALNEWWENHQKWLQGKHEDQPQKYKFYAEWSGNPPDVEYYRHEKWTKEECTCFQVYENVSEGTPVTPVFETQKELIDYLVDVGNFWGEKYTRAQAEKFVKRGYSFSAIMSGGKIHTGASVNDVII